INMLVGHIFRNNRTGANQSILTDITHRRKDNCPGTYPGPLTDNQRLCRRNRTGIVAMIVGVENTTFRYQSILTNGKATTEIKNRIASDFHVSCQLQLPFGNLRPQPHTLTKHTVLTNENIPWIDKTATGTNVNRTPDRNPINPELQ